MRRWVAVFVGGGLGSLARALLLLALAGWGSLVPVLLVNLIGAFALGVVYVLADDVGLLGTQARLFAAVGVLGGFTTFSTFAWGADLSIAHGMAALAAVYVVSSVVGGVTSVALGIGMTRRFVSLIGIHPQVRRPRSVARDMGRIETEDREDTA